MLIAVLITFGLLVVPTVASADPGDVGVEGPSHTGTSTPTGTKRAESVLWFNDGHWWGNLWDVGTSDFHIFRFDSATSRWVDTGVRTEPRAETHHDVLWDGTTLYVASYRFVNDGIAAQAGYPSFVRRYSYDRTRDTYTQIGRETQVNNHRTETLTIDKDTSGRLWATWVQDNTVFLNVTGTDGATWGTPFPHPAASSSASPANVSLDDTSALIAYGPGKMGLMWSRQLGDSADGFYWSSHMDSASKDAWSTPSAIVTGQRSGDDHMNLKWLDASGGRVFAAVKTSFTSGSQPLLQLLHMDGAQTWTAHTIATVSECPNRVIVLIDEAQQRLRTFATYPKPSGTTNAGVCTSSGGAIYEKSSGLDSIAFSTAKTVRILDADQYVHNVSSTKQNLHNRLSGGASTAGSGLMVIADVNATKRYWHHHEPGTAPPPADTTAPTISALSPTVEASSVPVSSNVTGTFSEAMDSSTINGSTVTLRNLAGSAVPAAVSYDSSSRIATLNPTADLAVNTTYTATVRGGPGGVTDLAGNPMSADRTWSFTTAAASGGGGGVTQTVTLIPTADSYVSSAAATTNYGTSNVLEVDASPASMSHLRFDLTSYAGHELTSANLQLQVSSSGSVGSQNVKLAADDWTETGVTYNTRPALSTTVGALTGPTSRNTSYTVALSTSTLATRLGSSLSLGLDSASSDGIDLASRHTTTPPRLVLTLVTP